MVRVSLPLPRGLVSEGQGLTVSDNRGHTPAALRPLTWHPPGPDGQRWIRRGLVTLIHAFADLSPVAFELTGAEASLAKPADFPATVEPQGDALVIRYAEGPSLRLDLLAPSRDPEAAPRLETVEENALYRWHRFHLGDRTWPRVLETRVDSLGTVVVIAHLQRRFPENGCAPDLGWSIREAPAPAVLVSAGQRRPVGGEKTVHGFDAGEACSLLPADGQYRLEHPAAPLKLCGRVEVSESAGEVDYTYWRCFEADRVPMQPMAWRRLELVISPAAQAPLTCTLEYPHQVTADWRRWDELYQTGPPLDLRPYPELEALVEYHHRAIVRSSARGHEWGNITSYADDRTSGNVQGMNRLNHCPPIFQEGYRSGDRRLLEAAVLWCDNFYDHSIWWGEDETGGTRYPNSTKVWRSNNSVSFCTKGYESFFVAYEQTGDPRMLEALEAQVEYGARAIHAHLGECRNVGDVRDFVRLHRYTGEQRYLDSGLRLFRELRTRLSTGDLFDQGGKPLQHDLPFIGGDGTGLRHGYAKPYIIGYALAGLPELVPLAPSEPKLRDVVGAVADFLASSQDPLGGWRYPHPRSAGVNLSQAMEHAWQMVQADRLLGPQQAHLDAVEKVLRQRLLAWRHTGRIASSLGGWEMATGVGASGQDLEALYQSPDERDFRRDYDEGLPSSGTCPPEGLVYLTEVLGYYLAQRPADGLLAAPSPEEPLGRVLARVPPGDTPVTGKPVHD